MNKMISQREEFNGEIFVPGDKSISHRALILGAIAEGVTEIEGFLAGEDCLATISCLRQLGMKVDINASGSVRVHGKGLRGLSTPNGVLDCGNSGTTARLLCGLLAGQNFDSVLDGDESLRKRPMARVIEPLRLMGAQITVGGDQGMPLRICGSHLRGIHYKMPIYSAQVKTAIILAGLYADDKTIVEEINEGLTRNHTELMLNHMTENGTLVGKKIVVPGDFSSAAFFIVLGLLKSDKGLVIRNVGLNPTRTGLLDALRAMGGDIKTQNVQSIWGEDVGDIFVSKSRLNGIVLQGDIVPLMIDEIPIFAVAAAFAQGETIIKDAAELMLKESNRIVAMTMELGKMGVDIAATNDGMIIKGAAGGETSPLRGAILDSHGDHRVAMSLAIAALCADGKSVLHGAHWANVSFPNFFDIIS